MAFKKGGKWFGVLLACFITFGVSLLTFSGDVSAANVGTSSFDLYYKVNANGSYQWHNGILYGTGNSSVLDAGGGITRYQFNMTPVVAGGNYATIHFETNIVATRFNYSNRISPWVNLPYQHVLTCTSNGTTVIQKNLSFATTQWFDNSDSNNTLTFYGDVVMSGFNQGSTYNIVCAIGSSNYSFYDYTSSLAVWFEQNPVRIEWSNDESIALLNTQIVQNETIINQNNIMIEGIGQTTDAINNLRNDEQNASDDISGQTPSDIPNSTSSQTTSIIGVISGFISSLSSYHATSCSLTLPFPNYAGGSTTVDPCSGKEIAPTIVQIASSLLLICTFIPLAFVVLRMIYNEIRSWTNG